MAVALKIEPLTAENYRSWKAQVKGLLMGNDLWDHVIGESVKPAAGTEEISKWVKADRKTMSHLLIAIGIDEAASYDDLDTSKEIWDKIKATFESSGPARKALLLKKLTLTRMKEGEDVKKHISEFCEVVKRLKEVNLEVIDEMLVILLLNSLPAQYEVFKTSIETQKELPSLEEVKVKILEYHEGHSAQAESDQGALYARNYKGKRKPQKYGGKPGNNDVRDFRQARKDVECYKCHKRGHIARYCDQNKNIHSARNTEASSSNLKPSTMLSTTEKVMYASDDDVVWCVDSGCTSHMCNDRDAFDKFTRVNAEVNLANNESTHLSGTGNVPIVVNTGREERTINIQNVAYVPDLRTNLLSVARATDHGHTVTFRKTDAIIVDKDNKVVLRASRRGNLYIVNKVKNKVNNVTINSEKRSIDTWHEKLGHVNERDLKLMAKKGLVYGLNIKDNEKLSECEVCIREKQTRMPFPKCKEDRTSDLLEIIHSDVCGPMRHASASGKRYFVTFIDDKSRWCEVYFIKNKSDVFEVFKTYKEEAEKQTGKKIKALQTDNGREYCNAAFDAFLREHGIRRRLTAPHTPQQNGVAERKNRTLVEMTHCMMRQAGAPPPTFGQRQ